MEYVQRVGNILDQSCSQVCPECAVPAWKNKEQKNSIAGCCACCAREDGYLREYNISYLKRKYNFDKKYGFFNVEHKLCLLPRHYRSETCLSYLCQALRDKIGTQNTKQVRKIAHKMSSINFEIRDIRWRERKQKAGK